MTKCDTLIIGGGVPGLVLALKLASAGLTVTLADAGPAPAPLATLKPDGRTVALMGGSVDILAETGIWAEAKTFANPLKRMAVVDDSSFPAGADERIEQIFDATELGRQEFGWNIPLAALRALLANHVKKQKTVTVLWNCGFESATQTDAAITVKLSGQKPIETSLLVGCDGRSSPVREYAQIKATRRPYGQRAITCLIAHTKPHNNTSMEFHRPGGPFTYVPMPGNQCSVVWVEKDTDADAFLKLPKAAFTKALEDRTRGMLGRVELLAGPASWPLEYLRSEKLTATRIALAAEAAHVISPIGAQGLNLSLRDVNTLAADVLRARALGLDIGSRTVLRGYENARKGDVISRSLTIDLANQAVATDTNAIRLLRRLTLRALLLPGPWRQLVMKKGLAV